MKSKPTVTHMMLADALRIAFEAHRLTVLTASFLDCLEEIAGGEEPHDLERAAVSAVSEARSFCSMIAATISCLHESSMIARAADMQDGETFELPTLHKPA
jgi:hypothetical protein